MVKTMSSKPLQHIGLWACALLLAGCASSGKLRSDYDQTVDFSGYNTYNFMEGAGPDTEDYQSLFTRYMMEAISQEMENRGYVKADNPDLLVNFNAFLEEKTKVTTTTTPPPMGGYYGYRRGIYRAWPGYDFGTETHVSQYTQGTLNIDIVDRERSQLVWEAVGVGRITDKTLENVEESVKNAVPKFFERYPFTAGTN